MGYKSLRTDLKSAKVIAALWCKAAEREYARGWWRGFLWGLAVTVVYIVAILLAY